MSTSEDKAPELGHNFRLPFLQEFQAGSLFWLHSGRLAPDSRVNAHRPSQVKNPPCQTTSQQPVLAFTYVSFLKKKNYTKPPTSLSACVALNTFSYLFQMDTLPIWDDIKLFKPRRRLSVHFVTLDKSNITI